MKTYGLRAALSALPQATSAAVPGQRSGSPSVLALVCLLLLQAAAAQAQVSVGATGDGNVRVTAWNDIVQDYITESYNQTTQTALNNILISTGPSYGRITGGGSVAVSGGATFGSISSASICEANAFEQQPPMPVYETGNSSFGGLLSVGPGPNNYPILVRATGTASQNDPQGHAIANVQLRWNNQYTADALVC